VGSEPHARRPDSLRAEPWRPHGRGLSDKRGPRTKELPLPAFPSLHFKPLAIRKRAGIAGASKDCSATRWPSFPEICPTPWPAYAPS
jgi:hypothetical protein